MGCNPVSIPEIQLNGSYAFPLINSKISFKELLTQSDYIDIQIGPEGEVILKYSSELIDQSINEILPSISSVGEIPILDSVSVFPLETANNLTLKKAIFEGDEMRFRYSTNYNEDVHVNMRIPEMTKEGEIFNNDYTLSFQGSSPTTSLTESILINGYEYNSPNNTLTLIYDARLNDGTRILLDFAAMSFNEISFAYGEGNFKRTVYDLKGDVFPVNIYSAWLSGKLEFEDPKINFNVTHSYGFPISLNIKSVNLSVLSGETKLLSGSNIGKELLLNYPSLEEVGSEKTTSFTFDQTNSNLASTFNEKVNLISYSVDAVINPANDTVILGYITNESFFNLYVDVELPMIQKIENLALRDTFDISPIDQQGIKSAELKIVSANSYPTNMKLKLSFLDNNGAFLFSLFKDEALEIEAGILQSNGTTLANEETVRFVELDKEQLESFSKVAQIIVEPSFDSSLLSEDFITFYSDQYLELRIGVILQL